MRKNFTPFYCRFQNCSVCLLCLYEFLYLAAGEETGGGAPAKQLQALRVAIPLKIDGVLDEEVWQQV